MSTFTAGFWKECNYCPGGMRYRDFYGKAYIWKFLIVFLIM